MLGSQHYTTYSPFYPSHIDPHLPPPTFPNPSSKPFQYLSHNHAKASCTLLLSTGSDGAGPCVASCLTSTKIAGKPICSAVLYMDLT